MSQKGFLVKVDLDVQKVTCPGVCLCSNGKISLQIHMLESSVQTRNSKPAFPFYCHEKFIFSKTFNNKHRLNELQRSLNNEWFYAELIQWKTCDEGCVLATFQTSLDELLYPSTFRDTIAGIDIDLLMEPTKLFPGTIAPKLEICTKTTIEEILCEMSENSGVILVNPKAIVGAQSTRKGHPRKVCHSIGFSRAQRQLPSKFTKHKPIFSYRRVSDDLILRNNPNVVLKDNFLWKKGQEKCTCDTCYCRSSRVTRPLSKIPNVQNAPEIICSTGELHKENCKICATYEGYFSSKRSRMNLYDNNSLVLPPGLCSFCKNHYKKYHLRSGNGSPNPSNFSDHTNRKICLCIPEDRAASLMQQLHEKFSRTIDTNSKFFQKCIACDEVVV